MSESFKDDEEEKKERNILIFYIEKQFKKFKLQ